MPTNLIAVAQRILLIRGQKVMLDADLAELFGVPTKVFNQAIRRNLERFPADFMSQLTEDEHESLRSQIVTSKTVRGGRRYLPYVFTEHGAIMAATILNSPKPDKPEPKKVAVFVGRKALRFSDLQRHWRRSCWNWSIRYPVTTKRLPD
ncbi:MAG: ORF6N domain-containing protein [Nitrosomonadales bacterium]|nr:ORF6N domain-containing protein [Nitrosomonadales bacterium]